MSLIFYSCDLIFYNTFLFYYFSACETYSVLKCLANTGHLLCDTMLLLSEISFSLYLLFKRQIIANFSSMEGFPNY